MNRSCTRGTYSGRGPCARARCPGWLLAALLVLHACGFPAEGQPPRGPTPAKGSAPDDAFTFAVFGDNQPGTQYRPPPKIFGVILDEINVLAPDFVISLGDIIEGSDNLATFRKQIDDFVGFISRLTMPYHVAFGNHDMYESKSPVIAETFGPLYHSFDHKGAHFVILNSDMPGERRTISGNQWEWLKADLARSAGKKPIVVAMHRPLFPVLRWEDQIDDSERDKLHRLFRASGVTAVFSGHQHLYDRQEHDGIPYYISGGAGGVHSACDIPDMDMGINHFLLGRVQGGRLEVELHKVNLIGAGESMNEKNPLYMSCDDPCDIGAPWEDLLEVCGPGPDPSSPASQRMCEADACYARGDLAHAVEMYDAVLRYEPGHPGAENNRAVIRARKGDCAGAARQLSDLLAAHPDMAAARYNLALLLAVQGRAREAARVAGEGPAADTPSPLLHCARGIARWSMGDVTGAAAGIRNAARLDPGLARAREALIVLYAETGDYARAMQECEAYVRAHPGTARAWHFKVRVHYLRKEYAEARNAAFHAATIGPLSLSTLHLLGNACLRQEDYATADRAYSEALKTDRRSIGTIFNLAICRTALAQKKLNVPGEIDPRERDRWERVLDLLKTVAAEAPGGRLAAMAYNNMGVDYYNNLGALKVETLEEYFDRAIAADPGLAAPLVNRGNLFWETDKIGRAGLAYLKATAAEPRCLQARYNLALLLVSEGKIDEAIEIYQRLLAMYPSYCHALNGLAEAYAIKYRHAPEKDEYRVLAVETWRKSYSINTTQCVVAHMIRTYSAPGGPGDAAGERGEAGGRQTRR